MDIGKGIDKFRTYSLIKRVAYMGMAFVGIGLLIYLSVQSGGVLPAAFIIGCCLKGLWGTAGFLTGFGFCSSLFMERKRPELIFKDPAGLGAIK